MGKAVKFLAVSFLVLSFLSGCKVLMPSQKEVTKSSWNNYGEVMAIFNEIKTGETTFSDLQGMGLDPAKMPNTAYLNPLSVRNLFLPDSPIIEMEHLPDGVQKCLKNFDKCSGYKFRLRNVDKRGAGSLILRMTGFRKQDITTGIDVGFYVFLVDDLVVYKLSPEGTPDVHETETKKNPLGPLQSPADAIKGVVNGIIPF